MNLVDSVSRVVSWIYFTQNILISLISVQVEQNSISFYIDRSRKRSRNITCLLLSSLYLWVDDTPLNRVGTDNYLGMIILSTISWHFFDSLYRYLIRLFSAITRISVYIDIIAEKLRFFVVSKCFDVYSLLRLPSYALLLAIDRKF